MRKLDCPLFIGDCTKCGRHEHLRMLEMQPNAILCMTCWAELKRYLEATFAPPAAEAAPRSPRVPSSGVSFGS